MEYTRKTLDFLRQQLDTNHQVSEQGKVEQSQHLTQLKVNLDKVKSEFNAKFNRMDQAVKHIQVSSKDTTKETDDFEERVSEIELRLG